MVPYVRSRENHGLIACELHPGDFDISESDVRRSMNRALVHILTVTAHR